MNTFNLKQMTLPNISGLTSALNTYMPPLVSAGLVVVLAQSMATLTWNFVPETPYVAPPNVTTQSSHRLNTQANNSANAIRYNKITNFHLFGIAQNEAKKPVIVTPVPTTQEAPDTQLRLTLKGVVASDDMMNAWAIVADRTNKENSYGIGAALPGGATLKEIYSDRIILLHNGRLETLRIPKTEIKGTNNRSNSRRSSSRRNLNKQRTSSNSNLRSNVNRLSSQATQTLRDYKDKLLNDPQSVMNSVRAEPYRQAGKLKGYRIFPGRDKQLFGQIGLEPGDIVTSVNGIELDSPLKGLEIMQQLSGTANVSVQVLRNGVSQTFETSLN